MSPTAKMPGVEVWNFSVSTVICLRSMPRPQSAIGPSLGLRPKNTSSMSSGTTRVTPSPPVTLTPQAAVALFVEAGDLADDELHLVGLAQLLHLGHAGRRGAEAVAAVHQDHALGLVRAVLHEVQRPVERRIAAADDDQVLARELRRVAHAVVHLRAVELLEAVDLQRARLERAHAAGDEDGLGQEARALGRSRRRSGRRPASRRRSPPGPGGRWRRRARSA
jgi:hypothetical protein